MDVDGRLWTNFGAKSLKGNKKPELLWTTRDVFLVEVAGI